MVAEADADDDIARPLMWPGRSVAVEVLASESGPEGRWVDIDVGLLRRYLEAPIPVYYVTDMIHWDEGCLDPLGLGPRPYLDDVTGMWSAHSMAGWLDDQQAQGVVRVNLSDVSELWWRDFLRAFVTQSGSEAPPGRIGSVAPLSSSLLSGPEPARKILEQQTLLRLGAPPPARLYDYLPTDDGYVECTTDLKADLRRFAAEVEAERTDGGDGLMVLTMPWDVQVPSEGTLADVFRLLVTVPRVQLPDSYSDISLDDAMEMPDDPF
ncbi:hypothetical protein EHW97_14950 [Aeromicrobium camelliae]|uniref:Uncharacterized protein n=1 Tax=Aeromicrobium camelliae TaxID=1538144 RepID=A0A3N6W391_9ACTN|nr:hypothetical protein [Aeromicrobium camelliae]RQN01989.1 hypothetical protein EHW97_14950 [Aeromicrobium camelliae]